MALPGLPVARLVNVTVNLQPAAPSVENVDTCLIVGSSTVIDTTQRMRTYSSLSAVAQDFSNTAPEYLAAVLWFEQNPAPNTLNIGRWAQQGTNAQVIGGPLTVAQQNIALWQAITTGGFSFQIAPSTNQYGTRIISVYGLNFASQANLAAVAATITTAIGSPGTVTWRPSQSDFLFTSANNTVGSSYFFTAPIATGIVTFTANPANLDTLTLNGTTVTFVTGTPVGNQVLIGSSTGATLTNLYTFLLASTDVNLVQFTYGYQSSAFSHVLYVNAAVTGAAGNLLTLAKVSSAITVSGATLSGGSGADISGLLGMTAASSGAYLAAGIPAESPLTAVQILDNMFNDRWYGLVVLQATNNPIYPQTSDHLAIAAYVEGDSTAKHFYGITSQDAAILTGTDSTSVAYQLKQLGYNHTAVQYSSTNPAAVVSLLARILTTNWTANNSTITLMYKTEPGIVAETLNVTQANAIDADNCNVFVNYNNSTAIIESGICCSGQYIDTVIGLDYAAITLQANWYAALYESPTKIPQTDAGMHVLATIAEQTLQGLVDDGLLAPGVWNSGGFGQLQQGSTLSKGYYVYQPPVASQSETVRQTRVSVPFQIAVKLAGAVQSIDGAILVNS